MQLKEVKEELIRKGYDKMMMQIVTGGNLLCTLTC